VFDHQPRVVDAEEDAMIGWPRGWWWRRRLWRTLDEWERPTPREKIKLDIKRWAKVRRQGAKAVKP